VTITKGVFSVRLDFGASAFPGLDRFLEIGVRPAGGGAFTTLAPRQQISWTPYAIRTLSAASADALSAACVGCVHDAQIDSVAGSKVTGTIPAASVPGNSGSYIQNGTSQQAGANFNIGGNGVVNGDLTVNGTLNANLGTGGGSFIQNQTTPQAGANFDVGGNGTVGGTLVAGSVGAGVTAPQAPLQVGGTGWFAGDSTPLAAAAGVGVAAGFATKGAFNDEGYLFAYDYAHGAPKSLVINNPGGRVIFPGGNVGIGVTQPAARLEVAGDGVAFGSSNFTYTASIYGHDADGIGVEGDSAVAHTTNLPGVYGHSTGDGGVGVLGQADVGNAWGVYGETLSPTGIAVNGINASSGIGVNGSSATSGVGVNGLSQSGTAVAGISQSGTGVYAQSTSGYALFTQGNAGQTLAGGGMAKALVFIAEDGTILRCYNSQNPSATPNCGFTVFRSSYLHFATGERIVDFGFPVIDRFFALSPVLNSVTPYIGATIQTNPTPNQLDYFTYLPGTGQESDAPVFIVVY